MANNTVKIGRRKIPVNGAKMRRDVPRSVGNIRLIVMGGILLVGAIVVIIVYMLCGWF